MKQCSTRAIRKPKAPEWPPSFKGVRLLLSAEIPVIVPPLRRPAGPLLAAFQGWSLKAAPMGQESSGDLMGSGLPRVPCIGRFCLRQRERITGGEPRAPFRRKYDNGIGAFSWA
jgi:hypothetical protein